MQKHIPVMIDEVLKYVPNNAKIVVDGTLGHGGHTKAILDNFDTVETLLGFDLDPNIFENTKKNLSNYHSRFIAINKSYSETMNELENRALKSDFFLLDLGVNMEHFKDETRGFSLNNNAQLDMRFDNSSGESAKDILNKYDMKSLSNIFQNYADFTEDKSDEISKSIIKAREENEILSTKQLKDILQNCGLGFKASVVIFQAIRIHVNHELDNITNTLEHLNEILNKGGICCVITYHSMEDRIVKQKFKYLIETYPSLELINRKVLKPKYQEIQNNRASRSAKMRMIKKI